MPPAVTRIYDLARDVLDAIIDHWPAEASPLPDLRFVSNGSPVVQDGCEFAAVAIERTYSTAGDVTFEFPASKGVGLSNRAAVVMIGVIRCVPTIDGRRIPTAAETEASAALILTDAQAMWQAVYAGYKAGEIDGCGTLAFDSWTQEIPQGGMGGGTLRLRVLLQ